MIDMPRTMVMACVRCGLVTLVAWALVAAPLAAQTPPPTAQQPEKPQEQTAEKLQGQTAEKPQAAEQKQAQPAEQQKPAAGEQTTRTIGSEAITSAEALARDPRAHYGKVVIVQSEIERVIGDHAFLLDEDAVFAGPDILVLVPSGVKNVGKDATVRVTGTVRPFVIAEIERDFDWFSENDLTIDLRGRPVIIADSVRNASGGELAGAMLKAPAGAAPQAQAVRVTAGELAGSPDRYVGKRVTVRAEVEDVHNRQLFTLDEDRLFVGPDVIVYARDGRAIVGDDQMVTVTGIVRKFVDTELFGTADWFDPWFNDLDAAGRGLVRSRPVIVADSIVGPNGTRLYHPDGTPGRAMTSETPARNESRAETGTAGTSGDAGSAAAFTIGEKVSVNGTIRSIATDRAFWLDVEGREGPTMVIVDAAKMAEMSGAWKPAANQHVQVTATVKEVPGQSGQVKVSEWGMPAEDAKRFSEQKTYLYAETVSLASR